VYLFDSFIFRFVFFFSSRRRHTISKRDWSSRRVLFRSAAGDLELVRVGCVFHAQGHVVQGLAYQAVADLAAGDELAAGHVLLAEIGRASCRERVKKSGDGGTGKKKKRMNNMRCVLKNQC